jgi:signal transduction histidine kinase
MIEDVGAGEPGRGQGARGGLQPRGRSTATVCRTPSDASPSGSAARPASSWTSTWPTAVARLTRDQEVVVLRSVQEALANVRRHAHAQRVTIRLLMDEDGARVEIGDDGVGFAPGVAVRRLRARGHARPGGRGGRRAGRRQHTGGGTRVVVRVPAVAS